MLAHHKLNNEGTTPMRYGSLIFLERIKMGTWKGCAQQIGDS